MSSPSVRPAPPLPRARWSAHPDAVLKALTMPEEIGGTARERAVRVHYALHHDERRGHPAAATPGPATPAWPRDPGWRGDSQAHGGVGPAPSGAHLPRKPPTSES